MVLFHMIAEIFFIKTLLLKIWIQVPLEIQEKIYDDIDDDSTVYGSYKIYSAGKKGVYYVNNYVALDGKKHARLYLGFDKKQNTVVILDKNLNVIEVLQRVAVN